MFNNNIFFKPIENKVELPEDVVKNVKETEKAIAGEEVVDNTVEAPETAVEQVEEIPAEETVEETKEAVEEQVEARDDLTGGVATLSEPDEDGFQTLLAPEGYEGEEVFEEKEVEKAVAEEPEIVDQVNVVEEEQQVVEPVTETAQAEITEEFKAVLGENEEVEIAIPEDAAERIHKVIEENTKDAVKKILEIMTEVVSGK